MTDPIAPPAEPYGPSRRALLGWTVTLPLALLAPIPAFAGAPMPGSRTIEGKWDVSDLSAVTRWPATSPTDGPPRGRACAPDGRLWFTDWENARIGWKWSATSPAVAAYTMPLGRRSGPSALAVDGAGLLYVAEMIANRVTRFDPAGERFDTSWELPLPRMRIRRLAIDGDGCVWCADPAKGKLAQLS